MVSHNKKEEALRLFGEGLAHQQAGRLADACTCYERGLKQDPGNPDALFLLGQALFDDGDVIVGERKIRAAISARPQAANYRAGFGQSLFNAGRWAEAVTEFGFAARVMPQNPVVWRGLALSGVQAGTLDVAMEAVARWLSLVPDDGDAASLSGKLSARRHFDQGVLLAKAGSPDDACEEYEAALRFDPNAPEILTNLANLRAQLGAEDQARALYERAIAIAPENATAYFNLGMLHLDAGRRFDAVRAFESAVQRDPDNGLIAAHLLFQKMHLCQWDGVNELAQRVREVVEQNTADIPPFIVLSMPGTTPALQRRCAENHSACLRAETAPVVPRKARAHDRLRVGYLSSDFKSHATAFLMIDMLEAHDRCRFEVFGLSYGIDDHSPMRTRVEASFEHFVELAGLASSEAVKRIAALELDILIDLKGYTEGNHSEWLQYRLAPMQINWLGYPGTLGAPWVDCLIADEVVAPLSHQWMFSERLLHLPGSYQPNCRERECGKRPSRADEGLPDDAIVLCSFNQTYKITPEIFDVWLDVLSEAPRAVLWLWASNPWAEDALRQVAAARGISPERLIFAEGRAQSEHLARLPLADLALDTFPCNGHTTTSDALWAGVPVVTLQGDAFAARVAASLLAAVGLGELVVPKTEDYFATILRLTCDAGALAELRSRTSRVSESGDVFRGVAFVRKLEGLLEKIH